MGNRPLSISIAVGISVLTTLGPACAQSSARGSSNDQPAPAASGAQAAGAQPGSTTGAATPPAGLAAKPKRAAAPTAEPSSVDAYIVNRPPVRREVFPQSAESRRPVQARPATAPSPPVAAPPPAAAPPAFATTPAAAASANNASAADAAAANAGRKMWPVVVGPVTAPAAGQAADSGSSQAGPTWSQAEIDQARAHCTAVLKGVDAVLVPEDPIKQGECGSPVLFRLTSVGKSPVVEVSPPVLLTCDMVASLDKWMKREVQPQSRAQLGGSIVKLETMSSYSCRNAYGRAKTRLSEHGKANAIDIAGFSTARDTTTVLAGWGPTQREQRAIAQRLEAERAAQTQSQSQTQPQTKAPASVQQGGYARAILPPQGGPVAAPVPSVPGIIISGPGGASPGAGSMMGFGPQHLGGPKPPEQAAKPVPGDAASKQKFLREIHASACKYFGTVLGPEANNAHRNHFHLDMAQRSRSNFCE